MNDIKFSIITPVFNREKVISKTIESVISQDYKNYEYILVDDASTDCTEDICKIFEKEKNEIKYIRTNENGGVCVARNIGLDNVIGDYILFLDSDNTMYKNVLSTLNEIIMENKNPDIICFGYDGFSKWVPHTDNIAFITKADIREKYIPVHLGIENNIDYDLTTFVWNKCYKSNFIINNKLYFDNNRRTWEDGLFLTNCLDKAKSIVLINSILYNTKCEDVEHLSKILFEDQLHNYIEDHKYYRNHFESEYDFTTENYNKRCFGILNNLFSRYIKNYGKQAKKIISNTIKEEMVIFWANNIRCNEKYEFKLKKYILNNNVNKIYLLYHPNILKRNLRKLYYFILNFL